MTIENEFANTEYLADPAWLQAHRNDPDLVIVDLDAEAGYLRGHIPGALFLDNNYERNPETGWVDTMPPDRFAAVCQALGIGDDTLVVACDNNMSLHAARFWWTLRLLRPPPRQGAGRRLAALGYRGRRRLLRPRCSPRRGGVYAAG